MLRFQHSEYFWFLLTIVILVGLFFLAVKDRKNKLKIIGDETLVHFQLRNFNVKAQQFKLILLLVALFAGVIGLANLQANAKTQNVERKGIDVMIALDVSKSMLARDESPNRLEKAKQFVSKLIDKIGNNRVGLIVFAGRAYVSVPLTVDFSALKMNLSTITPSSIPTQGTVLGEAIKMARESFNSNDTKYKSIVLISDGEDHDENVNDEVKKAVEEGIMINTVGIGSVNGSPIWDEELQENKKDAEGNEIISKLNETELQTIASNGEGIYAQLSNAENIAKTMAVQINATEKKSFGDVVFADYTSYFQYFLLISLLLITIEFFISERKKSTLA
jgi:Ca-activated chloride channel family protein